MDIVKVSCSSCGAPISISAEIETLNCTYCGAALAVQRGEGYVALKLAEKVSQTIQQVGTQTQSSILEGTQTTQIELKRLQLSQELSSSHFQLSSIQAEIRALMREKATVQIKMQLRELRSQEAGLISRISGLQAALAPVQAHSVGAHPDPRAATARPLPATQSPPGKNWLVTMLLCLFLGFFGAHRFYTGHTIIGIVQLLTFGGAGIWWFIDLLLILTNYYKDRNGRMLQGHDLKLRRGCLASLAVFVALTLCFGLIAIPLDKAIFGIETTTNSEVGAEDSQSGPFFSLGIVMAMIGSAIAFAYSLLPEASIWQPVKRIFQKKGSPQQEE